MGSCTHTRSACDWLFSDFKVQTSLNNLWSFSGLLSLSVKGAEVASMTMDVIQSIPNLDWLSVWVKAYAFIHAGDNQRAINTIWWAGQQSPAEHLNICFLFHVTAVCFTRCVVFLPLSHLSSLEKKSLLRDNVDLLVSLADVYFRAGDTKNAILKFEQAQMLDPYLIKGENERSFNSVIERPGVQCILACVLWTLTLSKTWGGLLPLSYVFGCLHFQEWMFMDTWWLGKDTWRMLKYWVVDCLISQTSMQSPGWSPGESEPFLAEPVQNIASC